MGGRPGQTQEGLGASSKPKGICTPKGSAPSSQRPSIIHTAPSPAVNPLSAAPRGSSYLERLCQEAHWDLMRVDRGEAEGVGTTQAGQGVRKQARDALPAGEGLQKMPSRRQLGSQDSFPLAGCSVGALSVQHPNPAGSFCYSLFTKDKFETWNVK